MLSVHTASITTIYYTMTYNDDQWTLCIQPNAVGNNH